MNNIEIQAYAYTVACAPRNARWDSALRGEVGWTTPFARVSLPRPLKALSVRAARVFATPRRWAAIAAAFWEPLEVALEMIAARAPKGDVGLGASWRGGLDHPFRACQSAKAPEGA